MIANRSIPQTDVIPELPYRDVAAAAEWLVRVFGFEVRLRIGDGHRVQMHAGGGAIVLVEGEGEDGSRLMLRVEDAQTLHARIVREGGEASPPEDHVYGERQFTAIDCGGHRWKFTQSIADVDPASWGAKVARL